MIKNEKIPIQMNDAVCDNCNKKDTTDEFKFIECSMCSNSKFLCKICEFEQCSGCPIEDDCYFCPSCEPNMYKCDGCKNMVCKLNNCKSCGIERCNSDSCFGGWTVCDRCYDNFNERHDMYCNDCTKNNSFLCCSNLVGCKNCLILKDCGHYCCDDCTTDYYDMCPNCVNYTNLINNQLFEYFLIQNINIPIDLIKIIHSYTILF